MRRRGGTRTAAAPADARRRWAPPVARVVADDRDRTRVGTTGTRGYAAATTGTEPAALGTAGTAHARPETTAARGIDPNGATRSTSTRAASANSPSGIHVGAEAEQQQLERASQLDDAAARRRRRTVDDCSARASAGCVEPARRDRAARRRAQASDRELHPLEHLDAEEVEPALRASRAASSQSCSRDARTAGSALSTGCSA